MPSKHELQIGIIGIGMIGMEHIRVLRVLPRCSIYGIADTDEKRIAKAADEFDITRAYTDYKELIKSDELDAVIVCTPPFTHEEITMNALSSGKHVLCEKPMTISASSAARMNKKAKKCKKILASCSGRYRFSPSVRKAKELIDAGELGEIYHITLTGISRRNRPGIDYNPSAKWCLDKDKAGGGALLDWGIYDLNILFSLMDDLSVEKADGFCYQGIDDPLLGKEIPFNVEEHGAAILRCKKGLTVFWERAWAAHMNSSTRIRVYGSKAGIAFDPLAWTKDIFFQIYEDRSGKPVTIAPASTFESWNVNLNITQDFIDSILKNHPPATSGEEEYKILRVIESVYRSNQKKTLVSV